MNLELLTAMEGAQKAQMVLAQTRKMLSDDIDYALVGEAIMVTAQVYVKDYPTHKQLSVLRYVSRVLANASKVQKLALVGSTDEVASVVAMAATGYDDYMARHHRRGAKVRVYPD